MKEKEIVEYLKNNRTKGVIFAFMPKEVQEWCQSHKHRLWFYSYKNNRWETRFNGMDNLFGSESYTLDFDYDISLDPPKPEIQSGWVEFEIEDSHFHYDGDPEMSAKPKTYYDWFDWQMFLKDSRFYQRGFTAFGGWQYENDNRWYLAPAVKLQGGKMWNSYIIEQSGEATPVIPKKIRFWREAK